MEGRNNKENFENTFKSNQKFLQKQPQSSQKKGFNLDDIEQNLDNIEQEIEMISNKSKKKKLINEVQSDSGEVFISSSEEE